MRYTLILAAFVGLAGCGDPFRGIDRLSDTDIGGGPQASISASSGEAPMLAEVGDQLGAVEQAAVDAAAQRTDARPPRGLLAMLGFDRNGGARPANRSAPVVEASADVTPPPAAAAPRPGGGLFGLAPARRSGPDAMDVEPGTVMPYGTIARACNVPQRRLGTRIARVSGFQIYDTIPNSTAPRPHYITGFADGCPRTFTGALVLTGDVGTYEAVHYETENARLETNETDIAYEAIKSRVCRVRSGQPCGSQIDRLDRNTTFVTVYDRFGGGDRWVEILLHDRAVAAIDFKG
ncbi:hypothetical protein [Roseisalinus antarcticus]|uniref:Uncharacterized protein n=1 Tax=Roseisalinus antarcticus TaxID=254357 RepID=A0A1Y5SFP9_9RHOB|nr:hypothetical protein [Roseisalinus antarcticus]SLN38046.1 hypothetical protein ROA7023_01450 [Roseisalinus antarcticus]